MRLAVVCRLHGRNIILSTFLRPDCCRAVVNDCVQIMDARTASRQRRRTEPELTRRADVCESATTVHSIVLGSLDTAHRSFDITLMDEEAGTGSPEPIFKCVSDNRIITRWCGDATCFATEEPTMRFTTITAE